MSKIEIVVCDVEGHDSDDPVKGDTLRFMVGAKSYNVDICEQHQDALEKMLDNLEPYMSVAVDPTTAKKATTRRRAQRSPVAERENALIRAWAKDHHIDLGDRGRIPDDVREQYRADQARLRAVPTASTS